VVLVSEVGTVPLDDLDPLGLAAGAASAVLFATYTLLSARVEPAYGAVGAMFRAFGVATCFWLVFQIPQGVPSELVAADNVLRVAFVGLVGTLAPFLLYVWGIKRVRVQRAVIAATLEPAAAASIAWLWLDQTLSAVQVGGSLLILAAVISLQLERKEPLVPDQPSAIAS
ncbi:MAG TPA: DMT family transporter, partial [Actinomycetota bacterium]|nr:DMT family transporter [Actinomycetota bacterium]